MGAAFTFCLLLLYFRPLGWVGVVCVRVNECACMWCKRVDRHERALSNTPSPAPPPADNDAGSDGAWSRLDAL